MSHTAGTLLRARLGREWKLLGLAGLAATAGALLDVAPAWLIYRLALTITDPMAAAEPAAFWALAILAAACLRAACMGASLMASHAAAFRVIRRLREEMVETIARLPLPRLMGQEGALKKTVLEDAGRIEGLLAHTLPDVVAALVAPLGAAVLLALADWRMLPVALLPLPLALWAQRRMMRAFGRHAPAWHEAEAEANGAILAYVRGLPTLKAFGRDASSLARLRDAMLAMAGLATTTARGSAPAYALLLTALSCNLVLLLPVTVLLAPEVPQMLLVLLLGMSMTVPLLRLLPALAQVETQRQGVARIARLLDTPAEPAPQRDAARPTHFDITFDGVGAAHVEGRNTLHGITFTCVAGSVTGIVGPSGAGKSTLLALLRQELPPSGGSLRIGGLDIRDIPPARLHDLVASVHQDSRLFSGSLRDNLRLAAPEAGDETLQDALRAVALVEELPQGLETPLGENGARLSGGQRQRVAIARALLKDAPILLLDEATAFLDAASELAVHRALARLAQGRTVLVVAHRLPSIAQASQIIVLRDGQVEAVGRHGALLDRSPTYRSLWQAQEQVDGWRLRGRAA
jgi:ATP-binding cassette subfamily B protein